MSLNLGIDIGTSACRGCVIDLDGQIVTQSRTELPTPVRNGAEVEQDPECWWQALTKSLDQLADTASLADVEALTIDGTSATLLCCDAAGNPLTPALMYNDARAIAEAEQLARLAPVTSAAHGPGASLAKLLWLVKTPAGKRARYALHQADWLLGRLAGHFGISDENNALKLGYDILQRRWPDWLKHLDLDLSLLPEVAPTGQAIGQLDNAWCKRWGFAAGTRVVSGTTDSTAGVIATGAMMRDAVTSLGSTLVLKVVSDQPVFAPEYGIYSHRLGDHWLAGGASNSGGAVLQHYFSNDEINRLSTRLQADTPTGLNYYPLVAAGERFPVNDPQLAPRLEPRPPDDAVFFQGLLEGIAAIEKAGYQRLAELGAPWPEKVITSGGGAANSGWRTIREQQLGIPVMVAEHHEAAYGAALLARGSKSIRA